MRWFLAFNTLCNDISTCDTRTCLAPPSGIRLNCPLRLSPLDSYKWIQSNSKVQGLSRDVECKAVESGKEWTQILLQPCASHIPPLSLSFSFWLRLSFRPRLLIVFTEGKCAVGLGWGSKRPKWNTGNHPTSNLNVTSRVLVQTRNQKLFPSPSGVMDPPSSAQCDLRC